MPSRDFSSEDLVSSWMMSLHSSTHSSQMKTVGPAMSLRTSCWFLPQNEQQSVFCAPLLILLIVWTCRALLYWKERALALIGWTKEWVGFSDRARIPHDIETG